VATAPTVTAAAVCISEETILLTRFLLDFSDVLVAHVACMTPASKFVVDASPASISQYFRFRDIGVWYMSIQRILIKKVEVTNQKFRDQLVMRGFDPCRIDSLLYLHVLVKGFHLYKVLWQVSDSTQKNKNTLTLYDCV
jgi:hypothetical protein